ncbi:hypothetical protein [Polaribacter porphyrae]|uniref:Uncharacterized protein n=1 Tax=Polaribacter porphyrae TaxID=1137780 RepID=A0A2S7WJD0_9FLAO|nr:hypothetical protein [Polaribacter porphyrae]PQJ77717.1 hypothetical protein BTO18_00305 [Polaribacter porphyrae]
MQIIGYIILFYVGFYFYRLAENYKKNKWLLALVGLLTFFLGYFVYLIYYRFFVFEELDDFTYPEIGFKSFLVGIITTFILFQILNIVWGRKLKKSESEVDKIGKL